MAFADVIARGTARRLAEYERWILEHDLDPHNQFCDLTQRLAYAKGTTTAIGCLLTNSCWYSHGAKRPLAPAEQIQLMGVPVFPSVAERAGWACPWATLLLGLPHADARRLAGNGLHVACVGAMLMWGFGEIIDMDAGYPSGA